MITWYTAPRDTTTYWHFLPETGEIVLDKTLTFWIGNCQYEISAGFVSDGCSCPQFLWSFLSPQYDPRTLIPSIIHDWLYQIHIMTRREADQWYMMELIANGFGKVKSYLVYAGVRIGGWSHW